MYREILEEEKSKAGGADKEKSPKNKDGAPGLGGLTFATISENKPL